MQNKSQFNNSKKPFVPRKGKGSVPHSPKPRIKKKPKTNYIGFKNRMKIRRVEPSGYTNAFIKDYLNSLSDDVDTEINPIEIDNKDVINFRRHLYNGYHLYRILISVDNHFVSGYTYRAFGWVVAHTASHNRDAVNMTIVLDKSLTNGDKSSLNNIIFFKTMAIASEIFMKSGKIVRLMVPKDKYDNQKKYLNKNWIVDNDQSFTDVFGNEKVNNQQESEFVVIKNTVCTAGIKIGSQADAGLLKYLKDRYDSVSGILPITDPNSSELSTTVAILKSAPGLLHERENNKTLTILLAVVKKCTNKEIHYSCNDADKSKVEDIIKNAIFYENSFYKHPYDDPTTIKLIYDGDISESISNDVNRRLSKISRS